MGTLSVCCAGREQKKKKNQNQNQKEKEKKKHEEGRGKGNKKKSHTGRKEVEKRGINLEGRCEGRKSIGISQDPALMSSEAVGPFPHLGPEGGQEIRKLPSETTLEKGGGGGMHSWAQEERGLGIWTNRGWGQGVSVFNCGGVWGLAS